MAWCLGALDVPVPRRPEFWTVVFKGIRLPALRSQARTVFQSLDVKRRGFILDEYVPPWTIAVFSSSLFLLLVHPGLLWCLFFAWRTPCDVVNAQRTGGGGSSTSPCSHRPNAVGVTNRSVCSHGVSCVAEHVDACQLMSWGRTVFCSGVVTCPSCACVT